MPRLLPPHDHEAPPPGLSRPQEGDALLSVLANPVRDHMIEVLTVQGPSTAADLATAVARSPATVRRHLRVLERCGAVERLVDQASVAPRAASFRATARAVFSDEQWARLSASTRRALFQGTLGRINEHIASALTGGGFDRTDAHVSWVPTALDEAGYAQIRDLLVETYARILAIQAGADARKRPHDDALETEVVVLHFLRKPGDREVGSDRAAASRERKRLYRLIDDLADEIPRDTVDWQRVARQVSELAALVEAHRAGE